MKRTRFAPSPTGYLHLGHAYSALIAHGRADPGEFLIRIEDIDRARSRAEYELAIEKDLHWLGLDWQRPVMRQSARMPAYEAALNHLISLRLCYPCACTRGDIRAALSAPQEGVVQYGPDGPVYPGTCRGRPMADAGPGDAIRLDMDRALAHLSGAFPGFTDSGPDHTGRHDLDPAWMHDHVGDIVLARRDMGTSYHLAVTLDDAKQGITEVVRGADLFEATLIHVLLQTLLGLEIPGYHHHRLIRDEAGKRLAKRDDARAIRALRAEGFTPADIRTMVGL